MPAGEPLFQTWCGTCKDVAGAVLEDNRGNPRWRVSRHHDASQKWCGGGRVVVPDSAVVPTGAALPV